ncbi:MAG: YraN family protein [Mogibacterium sp.]|nr:YraN family protein [Mogibacterium sp.]MBR2540666.1 YraN family protein [Mogibacterium sp.]
MRHKKNIGDSGEEFAARVLEESGYQIIERNYSSRYGEIDIIALRDGILHFIEVKTRTSSDFGYPAEAVTETKITRIRRTAESYISRRRAFWRSISFDVFEIMTELIVDCM